MFFCRYISINVTELRFEQREKETRKGKNITEKKRWIEG